MTRWRFLRYTSLHTLGLSRMRCNQRSLWLCEDPVPHSKQREMSLSKCLAPSIALRLQEMTHYLQKERASGRQIRILKILPVLRPRVLMTMDSRLPWKGWPLSFKIMAFPLLCSSVLFRQELRKLLQLERAWGREPRGCKPWEQESGDQGRADLCFGGPKPAP